MTGTDTNQQGSQPATHRRDYPELTFDFGRDLTRPILAAGRGEL
jgi:hypothetical protein